MTNAAYEVVISEDQTYLTLITERQTSRFHGNWLRDNALDARTRAPGNGQKLISIDSIPETVLIQHATIENEATIAINFFDNSSTFYFPLDWLQQHCYDKEQPDRAGWISADKQLWDHRLAASNLSENYSSLVQNDHSLCHWLHRIDRFGFALLKAIPAEPDGLLKVVNLFGYVRETNYGQTFDVRSEINPSNLAYTALGLQAHTDNPYRDPSPTMQILACMENSADGGDSMVVDGFQAAMTLREESEEHFSLLSRFPARFCYAGGSDTLLESKHPIIELGVDGELRAVRFNHRSAAPFTDIPFDFMQKYYQAYRHFSEIVDRTDSQVTFKLRPQELFIVDNTRVLHSRTAFSGSGKRWLRGCYPDKDGMLSTLKTLRKKYNDVH
ncbi:MAG: TauD/TfdA family dioxygenase [Acidiferrobacterales bacterium]|nr:TauD/TfdA family dioxygenase [Acidiferrobacterales bacterium]